VFFRVTACATLVVPTGTCPNERRTAERLTIGAVFAGEELTLQGAERTASVVKTAKTIAAFVRVGCRRPARIREVSVMRKHPA
jgi:hypothetical protein